MEENGCTAAVQTNYWFHGLHYSSWSWLPAFILFCRSYPYHLEMWFQHFSISIISAFWDWLSSCFAFKKLASLLHRAMVAIDRKNSLGRAAAFLSPHCCSLEQVLFYLSFPRVFKFPTATASSVNMLYSLSDFTSWEQFPKFRWHFLYYKFIQLFQIPISNA